MKPLEIKQLVFMVLLVNFNCILQAENPVKISPSINYYTDLSDTYGGGSLLYPKLKFFKSWYGLELGFGHFQSQSTSLFKIPIPELNAVFEIPIDEMSTMKEIGISGFIRPIYRKWILTDFIFGLSIDNSKSLFLRGVDFDYNINEKKFSYLIKDYQLFKKTYIGYNIGIDISFYLTSRIGLQLSTRIQDLNHGGSFFFVGGGLCFTI